MVGCLPLTSLFCLHRVQQLPPVLCSGAFPPTMGCPEAPSRRVSFRYVLAWGPVLGRWGGRRTGKQLSLPWFKYSCFVLVEALHPRLVHFSIGCRREGRWEGASLWAGYGSALLPTLVSGEVRASGQRVAFL